MGKVSVMRDEAEALIKKIYNENNPSLIADGISHFVIDSLRNNNISLYEAYLVNMEAIKFKRLGYVQSAWNEKVRISTCLALINQKLLAHVFDEDISAMKVKGLALEAYRLNKEKRSHYIMDKYIELLEPSSNIELLLEMLHVRNNYEKLSDDDGPYHNEVFPYHFYSPEEIFLNEGEKRKYLNSKNINEDIEELIIQLSIFES